MQKFDNRTPPSKGVKRVGEEDSLAWKDDEGYKRVCAHSSKERSGGQLQHDNGVKRIPSKQSVESLGEDSQTSSQA